MDQEKKQRVTAKNGKASPNRKKNSAASAASAKGKQPREKSAQGQKKLAFKTEAQKRYEIDNRDLPNGLPPVEPFLPGWEGSAPQLGESVALQKKRHKALLGKKLVLATTEPNALETELRGQILKTLENAGHAMSADEFYDSLKEVAQISVRDALQQMLQSGDLFFSKKQRIALPSQLGYLTGKLQTSGRGFGFFIPDDGSEDIYVPQEARKNAQNGDRVVVKLSQGKGGHAREAQIVAIVEHANQNVVGVLQRDEKGYFIDPDNPRFDMVLRAKGEQLGKAKVGQKVLALIDYDQEPPSVQITEVLGYPGESDTEIMAIIKGNGLPTEFSQETLDQVANVPLKIQSDDIKLREDLRALLLVTIDGAESKDFDDAISCEKMQNGNYLLGVHIADVSHYVREGEALDRDAYERGTSVYFIDRVVPMLPEILSNGICSLNPRADRLALSCFMEIDPEGEVVSYRISETVIKSKRRLVYDDVSALLRGAKTPRRRYKTLIPMLEMMQELSHILQKKREERGSIDFDIPEAHIVVDEDGKPSKIVLRDRGEANQIIESFMLLCNETVARQMTFLNLPALYRVHDVPDESRIGELNDFLKPYGFYLKNNRGKVEPKEVQALMEKIKGTPQEASIARVLLRSLKKAVYSEEGIGHFGLAAEHYLHFTSPIRRYPDLMVHRVLKEMMSGRLTPKRMQELRGKMPEIAQHCSERERAAMEVEREVDDLKKCEYMAQHIGEEYMGRISGVTGFGLFVELANTCEGLIRINDLQDDYYVFDEKNYRMVGRGKRKVYALGDEIKIRVESADINSRRVDFSLVSPEISKKRGGKAAGQNKGKTTQRPAPKGRKKVKNRVVEDGKLIGSAANDQERREQAQESAMELAIKSERNTTRRRASSAKRIAAVAANFAERAEQLEKQRKQEEKKQSASKTKGNPSKTTDAVMPKKAASTSKENPKDKPKTTQRDLGKTAKAKASTGAKETKNSPTDQKDSVGKATSKGSQAQSRKKTEAAKKEEALTTPQKSAKQSVSKATPKGKQTQNRQKNEELEQEAALQKNLAKAVQKDMKTRLEQGSTEAEKGEKQIEKPKKRGPGRPRKAQAKTESDADKKENS